MTLQGYKERSTKHTRSSMFGTCRNAVQTAEETSGLSNSCSEGLQVHSFGLPCLNASWFPFRTCPKWQNLLPVALTQLLWGGAAPEGTINRSLCHSGTPAAYWESSVLLLNPAVLLLCLLRHTCNTSWLPLSSWQSPGLLEHSKQWLINLAKHNLCGLPIQLAFLALSLTLHWIFLYFIPKPTHGHNMSIDCIYWNF